MGKHEKKNVRAIAAEDSPTLNSEQKRIAQWLKRLRFKRVLFGGLSEYEVWKKIDELNQMYIAALSAERIRYETLLEERGLSQKSEPREGGV